MKFMVARASRHDGSPWNGAVKESTRRIERRWNTTAKELEDWAAKGYNHRFEEPYSIREVDTERWWIEVDTLEELIKIIETEGHGLVVDRNKYYVDKPLEIIIYDGYLE